MLLKNYFTTSGRKKASTRIILKPGKGYFMVNEKNGIEYFQNSIGLLKKILIPLQLFNLIKIFDIIVKIKGSGLKAQAESISLAIAKILVKLNIKFRPILKKYKLLTRDPRKVERKKYGLRKARKAAQYSKR